MLAKNIALATAAIHETEIETARRTSNSFYDLFGLFSTCYIVWQDMHLLRKLELKSNCRRWNRTPIRRRDWDQLFLHVQCTHFGALRQIATIVNPHLDMRTIIANMRLEHFHFTRKRKRIINFRDIRSYLGRFRVNLHFCVRGMEIVSTLHISGFRHDPVMHFFTFLNANIRWNPGLLAFKVPSHRVGNKKVKLSEGFIWHFSGSSLVLFLQPWGLHSQ